MKIGDKLFKYSRPYIMEYVVIGIRIYEGGVLFEVECQSCTHYGGKCRVLIGGKPNSLTFIEMANDDEEQEYWHTTKGTWDGYFRLTLDEAKIDQQECIRSIYREEVEKCEANLKAAKEKLAIAEELIKTMEKDAKK